MKNPMQPLVKDDNGIVRFKSNAIVEHLLLCASLRRKCDLNDIAMMEFSQDDRIQFAQLIGYSLCGFHELSEVPDVAALAATQNAISQGLIEHGKAGGCRDSGCAIHCGVEEE